ncbi:flavodoxin family protein [Aquipuribacter nitratireducens]|uniref:Flavodoxin family protein n=1 Tax=Aquipuribacter nitratireducens TaxID=650104 RepID=A0ABW0GUG0_9MICO
MTDLTALVLTCTLSPSPSESSSELLGDQVLAALEKHGVSGENVRVVDHAVTFGVQKDMGDGDAWPAIRDKVLAVDILVVATPIWMGQPASVAKVVLERLDAEIAETKENGNPILFDKVAGVAVVGNEDGAHHVSAEVYQGLSDVGFSIPPQAVTYWVGQAMGSTDYNELDETPEKTRGTTDTLARVLAHLARVLKESPYPAG